MAETTGIAWCDSTFNPWIGCTKVSPACDHCYAERDTRRWGRVEWGAGKPRVRTSKANWRKPVTWNKAQFVECMACGWRGEERAAGRIVAPAGYHPPAPSALACPECFNSVVRAARRRVFCASLADVFDNEVPEPWRWDLFRTIAKTRHLDWLLLTKRIGNAAHMLNSAAAAVYGDYVDAPAWGRNPWPHVWLGITVCNQDEADRDIPKLLATPAAVRFLSIEPMLGPIDLNADNGLHGGPGQLDWVIVGGESGPHARPMTLGWAKEVVRQCQAAGVPVFVKQLGARPVNREGVPHPISDRAGGIVDEWPHELRARQHPKDQQP